MKVIKKDEFNFEIFLNKKINSNSNEKFEQYIKNIFNKLNKYYNLEIAGFYSINAYVDNDYGIILNVIKEDIDFSPILSTIDMKITLLKEKFLYELKDYDFYKYGDIYYYNDSYYLDLKKKIKIKNRYYLFEHSKVVYKKIDEIKKLGIKIN